MPPRRPMLEVRPLRWGLGLGVVAAVLVAGCGSIGQPIPARFGPTAAAHVSFPPTTYPPPVTGASGSKVTREVDSIRKVADELKAELLAALRRLDAALRA
jgi:hypothetical protein